MRKEEREEGKMKERFIQRGKGELSSQDEGREMNDSRVFEHAFQSNQIKINLEREWEEKKKKL